MSQDTAKRAIVIAPGRFWTENQAEPAELLHLLDRPFIHRVVESLVAAGYRRIDVVLCRRPERFEASLGDGARWGAQIRYHLARDPDHPYVRLPALDLGEEEATGAEVLLAHGDTLPLVPSSSAGPLLGGWASISVELLRRLPIDGTRERVEGWLRAHGRHPEPGSGRSDAASLLLDARTPEAFLEASRTALEGARDDLLVAGRDTGGRGWTAWNARIHPEARLEAPFFLGENSWIGKGAHVGPHAVIGSGAMVGEGASVRNAMVEPSSYLGEGLRLESAVVSRGWLMNADLGVSLAVPDPLMLANVQGKALSHHLGRWSARAAGALGLIAALPVILATAALLWLLRPGPVLFRPSVERGGGDSESGSPRSFRLFTFDPNYGQAELMSRRRGPVRDLVLRVLPGLVNVARGELALTGVEPRPTEAVVRLPNDWRALYRSTRAGLITEAHVAYGAMPDRDALFASEAHFSARATWRDRLRLMGRYLAV